MSYESESRSQPGILSAITAVISGWRRAERPQYAHPWTAYSPANFRPCETTKIALETSSIPQAVAASLVCAKDADNTDKSLETNELPTFEKSPQAETAENSEPAAKPVTALRLVSSKSLDETPAKPALPGLAAFTGRDFQLAARLASVDALNRKVAPVATAITVKGTGANRPIKQVVTAKRTRNIEPPAVRRQIRSSAEIVQLRLTRARAEHKQIKTLQIA